MYEFISKPSAQIYVGIIDEDRIHQALSIDSTMACDM